MGILNLKETMFTITVVEISGDGLLGMEFITHFSCEIYPSSMSMVCPNEQIKMTNSGTIGIRNVSNTDCYRVVTPSATLELPLSKSVLFAKQRQRKGYLGKWALVEPTHAHHNDELHRECCMIGRAVVDTEKNMIPLPVINVSDEMILINAGWTVGIMCTKATIDPKEIKNEKLMTSTMNNKTTQHEDKMSYVIGCTEENKHRNLGSSRGFGSVSGRDVTQVSGLQNPGFGSSHDPGFGSKCDPGFGYPGKIVVDQTMENINGEER
jgi:hypothetical protein